MTTPLVASLANSRADAFHGHCARLADAYPRLVSLHRVSPSREPYRATGDVRDVGKPFQDGSA